MKKWLATHKLATGLIVLNVIDVTLTLTIGSGFGQHEVWEGNSLGLFRVLALKCVFLPLVVYLCVKYHKKIALAFLNVVYGLVVSSWLFAGLAWVR